MERVKMIEYGMKDSFEIKKVKTYPSPLNMIDWSTGAYLGMSMNNNRFLDPISLEETISWIKGKTGFCKILVGDHLHRLNHMFFEGDAEIAAISKAKSKADLILHKFFSVADKIDGIDFQVLRSGSFYQNPIFYQKYNRLQKLYYSNEQLSRLINLTISTYLRRRGNSAKYFRRGFELSRQYLLEELVIFEMLAEDGYTINIYPGSQLPVMKAIVSKKLPGVSPILEEIKLVEIKYKQKQLQ